MTCLSCTKKLSTAKKLGFWSSIICIFKKFTQPLFLKIFFGVDNAWHGRRPYECTYYKKFVVQWACELQKNGIVVDVGCGAGEILGRVSASQKYGFDIDTKILQAARFLNSQNVKFFQGSLDQVSTAVPESVIDVIIMTQCLHLCEESWLVATMKELVLKKEVRYMIVDEFQDQVGRAERVFSQFGSIVREVQDWRTGARLLVFKISKNI